ncbi:MAG: leucine-rich repeat protein [Oscillospiraceae bacterium]|nr:leucine-rich repeat protein [Oscillospiraceae bacterium]
MKNFLSTTKGKIIAGAVTLAVIAGVIVLIILLNTGYRNIRVADLTGTSRVTSMLSVSDAYKGQNLVSGDNVEVFEKSSLTLALDSDKHVVASELTKFSVEAFGAEGKDARTIIHLETGTISNQIDNKLLPSESYVVESPNASMSVRGTVFSVNVFFDNAGLCHTTVEVKEGTVELAEKDTGKVKTLNAGQKANVVSRTNREPDRIPTTSSDIKPGGDSGSSVQKLTFGDFEYIYNETLGGIEITEYKGNAETVSVPAEIDGEKVVKIGELSFLSYEQLTNITIPYGVTEIGWAAFSGCTELTSVTLPDSVTSIEYSAFYDCSELTGVTLPDSVTSIRDNAFGSCEKLTDIEIPDGVTEIGECTFQGCFELTNVSLPDSVTSIGNFAFGHCYKLTDIEIPKNVTYIGKSAFDFCHSIKSLVIPEGVTVIEDGVFSDCQQLTSITIPNGVTRIGASAFGSCSNLTSLEIPDSVTEIGYSAFTFGPETVTYKGKTYTEDNFDELYTEQ